MANTPGSLQPADYSAQNTPFSITGSTSANALVEVRGPNGLLLPANENPVAASGAGAFTIASITSLTGNHGACYVSAGGLVSVPGSLSISDNFTRADGSMGSNWAQAARAQDIPVISGNKIVPGSTAAWDYYALWTGATKLGPDQTVIAQLGNGYGNDTKGPHLCARYLDDGNAIFVRSRYDADLVTHQLFYFIRQNGTQFAFSYTNTTDTWVKIVCAGTTVTFYSSADGSAWTQRWTNTDSRNTFTGQPCVGFTNGLDANFTTANQWIANFSASATTNADMVAFDATRRIVFGNVVNGTTISIPNVTWPNNTYLWWCAVGYGALGTDPATALSHDLIGDTFTGAWWGSQAGGYKDAGQRANYSGSDRVGTCTLTLSGSVNMAMYALWVTPIYDGQSKQARQQDSAGFSTTLVGTVGSTAATNSSTAFFLNALGFVRPGGAYSAAIKGVSGNADHVLTWALNDGANDGLFFWLDRTVASPTISTEYTVTAGLSPSGSWWRSQGIASYI